MANPQFQKPIPRYASHRSTIRISGETDPRRAAKCAKHFLDEGAPVIDFLYIGANAGQQAMKAMTIFAYIVKQESESHIRLAFEPLRFQIETTVPYSQKRTEIKDCSVWRLIILDAETPEENGLTS